jgi:hypothetical protein
MPVADYCTANRSFTRRGQQKTGTQLAKLRKALISGLQGREPECKTLPSVHQA